MNYFSMAGGYAGPELGITNAVPLGFTREISIPILPTVFSSHIPPGSLDFESTV
jgi:hypothetical protein